MWLEFIVAVVIGLIVLKFRKGSKKSDRLPKGPQGIPIFGYLPFLGSVPCKTISQLSRKWGPILTLKLGQFPVVFINDFEKIKQFYQHDATIGRVHLPLFEKRGIYGLGLLEGDDWKEVRRFLLRCLRDSGFGKRTMEASIQEEVLQAIRALKKRTSHPMYLKPIIEIAVINAVWYLLTSEKYDLEDKTKREAAEILSEGLSNQNILGIVAFLPWLARLFPTFTGYKKALQYFEAPEKLAEEVIHQHTLTYREGHERDFIDHALTKIHNTADPESAFYKDVGMKNLHYTLIDLFFAGSDTMSSTLGWAFLYLSIWEDKQRKVQEEIDKYVGRGRLPCLDDRPKMPYTEATMYEVWRLSSFVPLGLFHKSLEDIEFEDYKFPKGTWFLANLYHVFHDDDYWGDPEVFRPERFLTSEGNFKKDERLIPFFTGKRTCIGEGQALMQYFLFFTGILQNFTFSLNPETPLPDIGPRAGFILPPPKHLLIVTERTKLSKE